MNKLKNPKIYVPLLIIVGIVAILGISAIASKGGIVGHSHGEHGHEH